MKKILFLILWACSLLALAEESTSIQELRAKAEQGDADSQHNLALFYEDGQGVEQDYKKSIYWYLKAAKQGMDSSQSNLALLYYKGRGTKQDFVESYAWAVHADKNGNSKAKKHLDGYLRPEQIEAGQLRAKKLAKECGWGKPISLPDNGETLEGSSSKLNVKYPGIAVKDSVLCMVDAPEHSLSKEDALFIRISYMVFPDLRIEVSEQPIGEKTLTWFVYIDEDGGVVEKVLSAGLHDIGDEHLIPLYLGMLSKFFPERYEANRAQTERLFYSDSRRIKKLSTLSKDRVLNAYPVLVSCVADQNIDEHFGRALDDCKNMKMVISEENVVVENFGDEGQSLVLGKHPKLDFDDNQVCRIRYDNSATGTFRFARLLVNGEVKDVWLYHYYMHEGVEHFLYLDYQ